jgi:phosphoribosylanthranilate isomerase
MTVRVKICGITTPDDAALAAKLGADAVGLNFYRGSVRCISDVQAFDIRHTLPPFVEPVGVFVNERIGHVARMIIDAAYSMGFRTIQIHGVSEDPFPDVHHSICIIPAFGIHDKSSLDQITTYIQHAIYAKRPPDAVLVDAHVPGMYGGTGQTAPWELLTDFDPGVPLILAGGLTPENVAEAIRIVRPYAVDVASGVESAPGRKDPDKMRRFIENARSAL